MQKAWFWAGKGGFLPPKTLRFRNVKAQLPFFNSFFLYKTERIFAKIRQK